MIWLIGPGGAGKSTTGPLVAERLGLPFHDLDVRFAERHGDIDEFIPSHGYEAYARANVETCISVLEDGSATVMVETARPPADVAAAIALLMTGRIRAAT